MLNTGRGARLTSTIGGRVLIISINDGGRVVNQWLIISIKGTIREDFSQNVTNQYEYVSELCLWGSCRYVIISLDLFYFLFILSQVARTCEVVATLAHEGGPAALYSGYLWRAAPLRPHHPPRWTRRWFVLKRDNCLYYYKTDAVSSIYVEVTLALFFTL